MSSVVFIAGFWLGTFKFMFAHWLTYFTALGVPGHEPTFWEVFLSVQVGATTSMTVFYFSSNMIMNYVARRRAEKKLEALKKGKPHKIKRKFTRINKGIVWIKRSVGVYGVTFVAPLVMSIPIGSIVCAKFYGNKKITFPLMVLYTLLYSFIMCSIIFIKGD